VVAPDILLTLAVPCSIKAEAAAFRLQYSTLASCLMVITEKKTIIIDY
jgi:hypothetical protein